MIRNDFVSSVVLKKSNSGLTFESDGHIGALQITINHNDNFSFELSSKALVSDFKTDYNSTTMIIVGPEQGEIFESEGNFSIENVVAASKDGYIDTEISMPNEFILSNAYPNPFNPSTNLSLELNTDSDVSIKVFNVMGQLMDILSEGQMNAGTYAFT